MPPAAGDMTSVEIGYLRTAIVVIALVGVPGTVPLSLVAGIAFFVWTSSTSAAPGRVERRRGAAPLGATPLAGGAGD